MTVADRFAPPSAREVARLVRDYPLAWIVSAGARDFAATLLPLRPVVGEGGELNGFLGHFARSNRHVAALEVDPHAVVLCLGPHGYISPSWLADRTQAPTWNYASAQFRVELRFFDEPARLAALLEDLVGALEEGRPNAWSHRDMGSRFEQLVKHVIGFEAVILETRAKFKLGQDERADVYRDILHALAAGENPELSEWMRRSNAGREPAT